MSQSPNRIYKVIWNKARQAWVAVSECARSNGKSHSVARLSRHLGMIAVLASVTTTVGAAGTTPAPNQLPTGGLVSAGQATISSGSNTAIINQTTGKAAINWNSFDVGSAASVKFNQPDASSVTLNRVQSANPSQIYGSIQANGQVYLMNPSGVYFAPGASVNVGGIVATTKQMSDADFMAGKTTFSGGGASGSVVNEGSISAAIGGYVALLAPEVRNNGIIVAQQGTIALASGEAITLNFGVGNKLESLTVSSGQLNALVENKSIVRAPGGMVILSARALNQIAGSVINSGSVEASGVSVQGGRIILDADMVSNTGSIKAASDNQAGGAVIAKAGDLISTGLIDVSGVTGGSVDIQVRSSASISGSISSKGTAGKGGAISVSATNNSASDPLVNAGAVNLSKSSTIDTSGSTEGGAVAVAAQNVTAAGSIASNGAKAGTVFLQGDDALFVSGGVQARASDAQSAPSMVSLAAKSGTLKLDGAMIQAEGANLSVATQAGGSVADSVTTAVAARNVDVRADKVTMAGIWAAISSGTVTVNGKNTVAVTETATVAAKAADTDAGAQTTTTPGAVSIASSSGAVDVSGKVQAINTNGTGGQVSIAAATAVSLAGAQIDVSGAKGGGTISVSGNQISMDPKTSIKADAVTSGDGGTVNVIADLSSGTSITKVDGAISAKGGSASGKGGQIDTSANTVKVADSAKMDTSAASGQVGTWTIDPKDFTIAATGGDITGSTLASNLTSGNVSILSSSGATAGSGNINVNDAVAWNANKLTLTAAKDININATMTPSGTSSLTLNTATANGGDSSVAGGNVNVGLTNTTFSGKVDFGARTGTGFLTINGNGYTVVGDATTLQSMSSSGYYALGSTINASGTPLWNGMSGWSPIASFSGVLNGLGNSVTSLTMSRTGTNNVGVFNALTGDVRNIGFLSTNVNGSDYTGGLASTFATGTIANTFVTGNIGGHNFTGGLVGNMTSGTVSNAYTSGTINGYAYSNAGGLVGYMTGGTITGSGSGSNVTISSNSGGLVGKNNGGTINDSFATGNVTATAGTGFVNAAGGLVGVNAGTSSINNSRASGTVVGGGFNNGGLVGENDANATISGSYYNGPSVTGYLNTGGLVGQNYGNISNSYVASGASVHGATETGGFVGYAQSGTISGSYSAATVFGDQNGSTSSNDVGGFAGFLTSSTTLNGNYATGNVTGGSNVGGFVGSLNGATLTGVHATGNIYGNRSDSNNGGGLIGYAVTSIALSKSWASGNVVWNTTGFSTAGGLVGNVNTPGTIDQTFATGNVQGGTGSVGGLVGNNSATISNSYATGNVTGQTGAWTGGFVGGNWSTITKSYATGTATGGANVGGFAGLNAGSLDSTNIWNTTTGNATNPSGSAVGKTTAQMQTLATFTGQGWASIDGNFGTGTIWRIYAGQTAPQLRNLMTQATIVGADATYAYTGVAPSMASVCTTAGGACNPSLLQGGGSWVGGIDVGTYNVPTGFYSTGAGYDITYGSGKLVITPAALNITANNQNKGYGSTFTFTGNEYTAAGLKNGETIGSVSISSAGAANTATIAGGPYAINVSNATGGTFNPSNYSITYNTGLLTIGRGTVTITGLAGVNKVYDGTTTAGVDTSGIQFSGLVNGDTISLVSSTGAFANKNVGNGKSISLTNTYGGAALSNYNIVDQLFTTANITQKSLIISGITAANKIYDATTSAVTNTSGIVMTGLIGGDTVTVSSSGAFTDKNVGTGKTVNLTNSIGGVDKGNYAITDQTTATADITPKTLTISGVTASNKVYDGTTTASLDTSSALMSGLIGGDAVTLTASGNFADKNVGAGKSVSMSGSISGADAGNYSANVSGTLTADITKKAATVSGITAADKTYDGTTAATANTGSLSLAGVIGGDTVTVSSTGTFADKNAGANKTVNLSNVFGGADVGNYSFTDQLTTLASIAKKALTVSGITVSDKTYDATTSATTNTGSVNLAGLVGGDSVTVSSSGAFTDKNAGNNKTVNLTNVFGGADLGNYSVTDQLTALASIAKKVLTISGVTASNKVYDGTNSATIDTSSATMNGLIGGDTVTLTASGNFADKNAGVGKTVSMSGSIAGADAANYSASVSGSLTADITKKAVTVSGITASDKTYDGTTAATTNTGSANLAGVIGGDTVTVSSTGAFADKNAGANKTVNLTNVFGGADAANYSFTDQLTTLASIAKKALVVSGITALDKTYDGSTSATTSTSSVNLAGLVGGDAVTVSSSGAFADKNAGANKTINLTNVFGGADKANYVITDQIAALASIAKKALTISGITAGDKTYDGTTSATVDASGVILSGLVGGDSVTVSSAGAFADKNAGVGKTVNLANTIGGADKSNYNITDQLTTLASIAKKALSITGVTASDKTYDGTTNASVDASAATYSGIIAGDAVTMTSTGSFADANAGTGKTVSLTNTMGGADFANYAVTSQSTTTASIAKKSVTVSGITAANKTYDGTNTATTDASGAVIAGLIAGDAVTVSATGNFADANAGNGKTVNLTSSYGGAKANNYLFTSQANTTASVLKAALTITANDQNKNQGDTLSFAGTEFSVAGLVAGNAIDSISLASAGAAAGAGLGQYAIIPSSPLGVSFNAANYTIAFVNGKLTVVSGSPVVPIVPQPIVLPPMPAPQVNSPVIPTDAVVVAKPIVAKPIAAKDLEPVAPEPQVEAPVVKALETLPTETNRAGKMNAEITPVITQAQTNAVTASAALAPSASLGNAGNTLQIAAAGNGAATKLTLPAAASSSSNSSAPAAESSRSSTSSSQEVLTSIRTVTKGAESFSDPVNTVQPRVSTNNLVVLQVPAVTVKDGKDFNFIWPDAPIADGAANRVTVINATTGQVVNTIRYNPQTKSFEVSKGALVKLPQDFIVRTGSTQAIIRLVQ